MPETWLVPDASFIDWRSFRVRVSAEFQKKDIVLPVVWLKLSQIPAQATSSSTTKRATDWAPGLRCRLKSLMLQLRSKLVGHGMKSFVRNLVSRNGNEERNNGRLCQQCT